MPAGSGHQRNFTARQPAVDQNKLNGAACGCALDRDQAVANCEGDSAGRVGLRPPSVATRTRQEANQPRQNATYLPRETGQTTGASSHSTFQIGLASYTSNAWTAALPYHVDHRTVSVLYDCHDAAVHFY